MLLRSSTKCGLVTAGGINQYYGGRLIEYAASALASGNPAAVLTVFDHSFPEAYIGLMDHMKLSMIDNRLELGGYDAVDTAVFAMTGSIDLGEAKNREREGFARYKSVDNRFNIGAAVHLPLARIQLSYGRTNGSVRGDYLVRNVIGDQSSRRVFLMAAQLTSLKFCANGGFSPSCATIRPSG